MLFLESPYYFSGRTTLRRIKEGSCSDPKVNRLASWMKDGLFEALKNNHLQSLIFVRLCFACTRGGLRHSHLNLYCRKFTATRNANLCWKCTGIL